MSDEPKSKSTVDIYSAMGNDSLPDHLLAPDSPEKKKRIALHMREIEYVVFLEKFKIHQAFMAWVKNKLADDKVYYERDFFYQQELKQLFEHWQLLVSANLTAEQLIILDILRKNLDDLLAKLDNKIEHLTKLVGFNQNELNALEKDLKEMRVQYGREWAQHFDQPANSAEYKPIFIDLVLPEKLKSIAEALNFDAHFKVDINLFSKLGQQVGLKLSEGNTSESEIFSLIRNMAEKMIKEELNKKVLLFPEKDRTQLIEQWMKSSDVIRAIENLSNRVLKTVSANTQIVQKIVKAQANEIACQEATQKLAMYKHKLAEYVSAKSKANLKPAVSTDRSSMSSASFTQQVDKIQSKIQAAAEALKKVDQSDAPIKAFSIAKEYCVEALKQVDAVAAQAKQPLSQGKLAEFNLESFLKGVQTAKNTFSSSLPEISLAAKPVLSEKPQPATPILR